MSFLAMCDRCSEKGEITSRKFAGSIVVAVTPSPQAPMHLCEDCLAELMVDAVLSLEDTPTARDLIETKNRAADCSRAYALVERTTAEREELNHKLAEARSQTTIASRYDGWSSERAELLKRIEAIEAARDVALTRASQAEAKAADVVRKAAAAATQAKADEKGDPEYVASVAAREAKRASGRP